MTILKNFLYNLLSKKKGYSHDELYRYVIILAVALSAFMVHVLFALFFAIAGCEPLSVIHAIGVAVFIAALLFLRFRLYDAAALTVSAMIAIGSLATVWLIGADNYTILYLVLVLVMMMVIPLDNKQIPIIVCCVLPVMMIAAHLMGLTYTPAYDIGAFNEVLAVANILIGSIGIALLVWLERLIGSFVDAFMQEQMDELKDQAYRDSLTNLFNRRYADLYFGDANRRHDYDGQFLALVDIDDFKLVNDTYGHDAGDEVLRTLSRILDDNTRKTDLAFRWGGEEFLVLVNDTNRAGALALMEKIRKLIEETTMRYDGQDIRITATIGIAEIQGDIKEGLKACDKMMYYGKRNGKNQVVI